MLTSNGPAPRLHLVLYIEDNLANLALVEALLERRGDVTLISSCTARDGIVMAGARQPDVIVMDIHLPDMSGFDALIRLRDDGATAHIPVMALSSDAYVRQIEEGLAAGFFRYLTKPFKIAEFMEALDQSFDIADARRRAGHPAPHATAPGGDERQACQ